MNNKSNFPYTKKLINLTNLYISKEAMQDLKTWDDYLNSQNQKNNKKTILDFI